MNKLKKIIFFTQCVLFTILGPDLYIYRVHATGLDAQSGQLEYTCYNKSGDTFKRPPINIKFSGKNFRGEVKFFSKRRQKHFIQTFSGNVQFNGKYEINSDIYNINRKKVSKSGLIKFDTSKRQNVNVIKYLKSGVNSNFNNRRCVLKLVSVSTSVSDDSIAAAEKKLEKAKKKRLEEQQRKLEKERKIAEEKAKKKRLEEQQRKLEKERRLLLEKELRLKAEQEKIKKKAEELNRKKKLKAEKEKKKKLAEEKARKKKLEEQERKRKLVQERQKKQVINYKRKANNFYKDIEEFVKAGGDIDLVQLSDFFDVKPNPKNKWSSIDLSRYEKLRKFMTSVPQFVSFEKERIGERLKNSFAMKDQSVAELEKNLSELKGLMRKMFGSSEVPKIKNFIKEIQSTLSNFNQLVANKVLKKSNAYIASKLSKPKSTKKIKKVVSTSDTNWSTVKNDLTIQQQQFCQLTDRFYDNLNKARKSKNEIKVNMVHKERQENLDALIPQGSVNNWIFKVIKIDQVEDGSAAVVLGLQCRSFVGSGQTIDVKKGMSRKRKKDWRATIPYDDRRFRELAKLDQGQFIVG